MLSTVLKDVFQDINIYQDRFRFLQYPFDSPISNAGINFYKYYIMDTMMVDKEKCFHFNFSYPTTRRILVSPVICIFLRILLSV